MITCGICVGTLAEDKARTMQIYLVGGAVRDALLGLHIKDRDWVVVGATPEQMTALGFLPVGKDFPVFLHPTTREEYALARTERKTARGYRGFAISSSPDVTLEQDLSRRDLTVNAIAVAADCLRSDLSFDPQDLIDPHQGLQDVANKVLRHVTLAFCEDPVRILRVARLAARFSDFSVATETQQLMVEMVRQGEADHLVAERVWQELSRGLMEARPSRMLAVLVDCGALVKLLPQLDPSPSLLRAIDLAAQLLAPLPVRYACLFHVKMESDMKAQRVPVECSELAALLEREQNRIDRSAEMGAPELLQLLEASDAIRKPQRFTQLLLACQCLAQSLPGGEHSPYPQRGRLQTALSAVLELNSASISAAALAAGASGIEVGALIRTARLESLTCHLARSDPSV